MNAHRQFGPWATMFETGPRAKLSTFWKRRMRNLPSTARAQVQISRRLGLAVLIALATREPLNKRLPGRNPARFVP